MKLTKRETVMVIVGFIVVAVIAYVFYFLIPQMNRQKALLTQTLTASSNIQVMKAKTVAIEDFKKQIASMQSELDQKTVNIPHGSNDANILMYIRQLADRVGVDVSVTFADTTKDTTNIQAESAFDRRVVAIDLATTYPKLNQLLAELNKVELFNSVQVISAKYEPQAEPSATTAVAGGTESPVPAATPSPVVSENTLSAHVEVYFDAFKLADGESPSTPPLNANIQDRSTNMFPN